MSPQAMSGIPLQLGGTAADIDLIYLMEGSERRLTMSDASQGEGWWIASDERWYPPQDHPNNRPAASSQVPIPQGVASSDSAHEPSTDVSAVAVATAQKCANGHEMQESQVICSVCCGERTEASLDLSAPIANKRTGLLANRIKGIPVVLIFVVAVLVVVGASAAALSLSGSGSSTSGSSSPSNSAPVQSPTQVFLSTMSGNTDFTGIPSSVQVQAGQDACSSLQGINSDSSDNAVLAIDQAAAQAFDVLVGSGGSSAPGVSPTEMQNPAGQNVTQADSGYTVAAAVSSLCTQYGSAVQNYGGGADVPITTG